MVPPIPALFPGKIQRHLYPGDAATQHQHSALPCRRLRCFIYTTMLLKPNYHLSH
jgi:hypothetical protein